MAARLSSLAPWAEDVRPSSRHKTWTTETLRRDMRTMRPGAPANCSPGRREEAAASEVLPEPLDALGAVDDAVGLPQHLGIGTVRLYGCHDDDGAGCGG